MAARSSANVWTAPNAGNAGRLAARRNPARADRRLQSFSLGSACTIRRCPQDCARRGQKDARAVQYMSRNTFSRRSLLKVAAGAGALGLTGTACGSFRDRCPGGPLPPPAVAANGPAATARQLLSAVDTIVVVMMENRSFDHLLGGLATDPDLPVRRRRRRADWARMQPRRCGQPGCRQRRRRRRFDAGPETRLELLAPRVQQRLQRPVRGRQQPARTRQR